MPDMSMNSRATPANLPYTDSKAIGAADFYFAINATFRFVLDRFGMNGLRKYWTDLGGGYFAPVSAAWKQHGLEGVAAYWRAFFAAEPGADVVVRTTANQVDIEVRTCPAFKHLRLHRRPILPCFCQHCYYLNDAIAKPAGLTVRVEGGNGNCRQRFFRDSPTAAPQDLSQIKEAGC